MTFLRVWGQKSLVPMRQVETEFEKVEFRTLKFALKPKRNCPKKGNFANGKAKRGIFFSSSEQTREVPSKKGCQGDPPNGGLISDLYRGLGPKKGFRGGGCPPK